MTQKTPALPATGGSFKRDAKGNLKQAQKPTREPTPSERAAAQTSPATDEGEDA